MGSAFSAISGQIGRAFAVGALLPATIFVLMTQLFVVPLAPIELRALPILRSIDSQWQIGVVVAVSTILAVLLYVLNNTILRLYEGYGWSEGLIGRWLVQRHGAKLSATSGERARVLQLLSRAKPDSSAYNYFSARYQELTLVELNEYPRLGSVLPTRFGNIIRSFENYPQRQYRIAAITLWHRFAPKLSKEHAALIDDAKSSVDFLVHLSCLSYLAALLTLLLGLAFPIPFVSSQLLSLWLLRLVFFGGAGFLLYRAAVRLAPQWGDSVRAAFDLHRRAVLRDLGFEQVPESLETERDLWQSISEQFVFGEQVLQAASWNFRPALKVTPPSSDFLLSRGITPVTGAHKVTIRVENSGEDAIDDVVVNDVIPTGRDYVWASARIDGNDTIPTGVNPIVFYVGKVAAGAATVITYEITAPKS